MLFRSAVASNRFDVAERIRETQLEPLYTQSQPSTDAMVSLMNEHQVEETRDLDHTRMFVTWLLAIPLGVLVAVSGVAGSGKSSLIHGCLPRTDPAVTVIDQSAIRGSRRSNPATWTGILDPIRKAFAAANRVSASLFSANSEGACPACNGLGRV